jgi:hypothetical protein
MAVVEPQSKIQRWVVDTLLLALLGASASFAALWIGYLLTSSRVSTNGNPPLWLYIGGAIVSTVLFFVLRTRYTGCRTCAIIPAWWVVHFLLTGAASAAAKTTGMSLVAYLITWLVIGALGALVLQLSPKAKLAAGAAGALGAGAFVATRGQNQVLKSSGYGRLPPATVILLTQHVRTANEAATQLPPNAPAALRKIAVGVVLDHIVRDWWENENREGLTPTDMADMGAFVQLAWSQCRGVSSLPEAEAIFRAVMTALLDDWFNSWNADGVDGAPRWQWNA